SAAHSAFRPIPKGLLAGPLAEPDPNRLRWNPHPLPSEPTDFLAGLVTMAASADPADPSGLSVHLYAANRPMERVFFDADGELLIVPELGRLALATECGRIE